MNEVRQLRLLLASSWSSLPQHALAVSYSVACFRPYPLSLEATFKPCITQVIGLVPPRSVRLTCGAVGVGQADFFQNSFLRYSQKEARKVDNEWNYFGLAETWVGIEAVVSVVLCVPALLRFAGFWMMRSCLRCATHRSSAPPSFTGWPLTSTTPKGGPAATARWCCSSLCLDLSTLWRSSRR